MRIPNPRLALCCTLALLAKANTLEGGDGVLVASVDSNDGRAYKGRPFARGDRTYGILAASSGEASYGLPRLGPGSTLLPRDYSAHFMKAIPVITPDGDQKARTEADVSANNKILKEHEDETGETTTKRLTTRKELPPTPRNEVEKLSADKNSMTSAFEHTPNDGADHADVSRLEKPKDPSEKPHNSKQSLHESTNRQHLGPASSQGAAGHTQEAGPEGLIQPLHSFILSLTMILFSEVGDKTFLVAALMAMKHDRRTVFSAAFSALLVMTILSAILGRTVPTLVPKRFTSLAASGLFFVFGFKLLHEGMTMSREEGVSAELYEVEHEIAEKEKETGRRGGFLMSASTLEMGLDDRKPRLRGRFPTPPRSRSVSPGRGPSSSELEGSVAQGVNNLFSLLLSPAWVQTFVMTFLGEWGDRSQIATIAMAAGEDYWWVAFGAMSGHAICTGAAVLGGRAIAGRVSLKVGELFSL